MQASPSPIVPVFATLTPANTQAKIAFHEVYEYLIEDGAPPCFAVEPDRVFNREVFQYRLHKSQSRDDREASDTPTDPDTDIEENELRPLGLIWTGRYIFSLKIPPRNAASGWILGKGRQNNPVDVQLAINRTQYDLRGFHAIFNIHTSTGYLWATKASGSIDLEFTIDGHDVARGQRFGLNQTPMRLRMGRCEYIFEYTEYARSPEYVVEQRNFLTRHLKIPHESIDLSLTPTPSRHSRKIGDWTQGISLGKGTFGKVFVGTNAKNETVAIKIVERGSRTQSSVAEEIRVLEELTKLAKSANDHGRLVRLREVIYQNGREEYTSNRFEDVALVMEPAVRGDFSGLVEDATSQHFRSRRLSGGMKDKALLLFYDALQGLNFLHSHYWLHGDIKPANIGIDGHRAVLLDIGGAVLRRPGEKVPPTPGRGGTVWYLAPERELQPYDKLVDVWAMGVIGYELSFGHHPWKSQYNPWRPGKYEKLRPGFHDNYIEAMERLIESQQSDQRTAGVSELLTEMLRHPWAPLGNNQERIGTEKILAHQCWDNDELRDQMIDDRATKRIRSF
jgi:protein kinase-like protein